MIYDKLDLSKVSLGEPTKFKDANKFLYPIFYEDSDLIFTLTNKFFIIDGVKENDFKKEYIEIKSKSVNNIIKQLHEKLKIPYTDNHGLQRLNIKPSTSIKTDKTNYKNKKFKALLSFQIPTYYEDKDEDKKTLQINVSELIIIDIIDSEIEYDVSKLTLAD